MTPPLPTVSFDLEITDDLVERFRADGYTTVDRITTDEELAWLDEVWDDLFHERNRNKLDGFYETSEPFGSVGERSLTQMIMPELRVRALRDTQLVRNAKKVAAALLDLPLDRLTHWGHLIEKHGDGGHQTPWHQDEAYWEPGFDYQAVASWVPLRDVDVDDGCLWFVPGSHTGEVLEHTHFAGDPAVQLLVTVEEVDHARGVPVPLRSGGCSFHHPRMLHHSCPNTSGRTRRAVANEVQTPPVPRDVPADRPWHAANRQAAEAYFASTLSD